MPSKAPYQFYGEPMYDPRKENRFLLKPTRREDDLPKILKFVEMALQANATIIEIRDPSRSGKEGQYELYSDAGIDDKIFHDALKQKGRRKKDAPKD